MQFEIVNARESIKETYGFITVSDDMKNGSLYFAKELQYAKHDGVVLRMMHNKCKSYKAPDWMFRDWIEARVCPSGRQNIESILKAYHMREYNPIELCIKRKGICDNDDMMFRKLPDNLDIQDRLWR